MKYSDTITEKIEIKGKDNYEFTHRKQPKGRGNWAFNIAGEEKFFPNITFKEAQKQAIAYAKKKDSKIRSITVLT